MPKPCGDDDGFMPFPEHGVPDVNHPASGNQPSSRGSGSFCSVMGAHAARPQGQDVPVEEDVVPLTTRASGFATAGIPYFGYGNRGQESEGPKPKSKIRMRTQTNIPRVRHGPYVAYAQYITPPGPKEETEARRQRRAQARSLSTAGRGGSQPHGVRSVSASPSVRRTPSSSPTWSYSNRGKGLFTTTNYVSSSQPAAAATARVKAARSKTPPTVQRGRSWNYSNTTNGLFTYVASLAPENAHSALESRFRSPSPSRSATRSGSQRAWRYDNKTREVFHYEPGLR
eukprot:TRINITY_DN5353_c1_g1_i1.p1 TRINITY_DN5353_c1_g1~~TRINITY_DN5353_c1_g1_i1.p1  ORF type:complete len:285 (+),score=42.52 TRINITY_DN5353_c1_g1_i1:2-856(+)